MKDWKPALRKLTSERNVNFAMILVLGFLIGIAVKMEAKKSLTIGYNDYQIAGYADHYNLLSENNQEEEQVNSQSEPSEEDQTMNQGNNEAQVEVAE